MLSSPTTPRGTAHFSRVRLPVWFVVSGSLGRLNCRSRGFQTPFTQRAALFLLNSSDAIAAPPLLPSVNTTDAAGHRNAGRVRIVQFNRIF